MVRSVESLDNYAEVVAVSSAGEFPASGFKYALEPGFISAAWQRVKVKSRDFKQRRRGSLNILPTMPAIKYLKRIVSLRRTVFVD